MNVHKTTRNLGNAFPLHMSQFRGRSKKEQTISGLMGTLPETRREKGFQPKYLWERKSPALVVGTATRGRSIKPTPPEGVCVWVFMERYAPSSVRAPPCRGRGGLAAPGTSPPRASPP